MNLFVLHEDPVLAAKDNCDKHCNKMVLETVQMLANCFSPEALQDAPKTKAGAIRSHSYFNHPVSKFVRATRENMRWTIEHAEELERQRLLIGYKPHFSMGFVKWAKGNIYNSVVTDGSLSDFAIAIPKESNCRRLPNFEDLDTVSKYRAYYKFDKPFATWKNREKPKWMLDFR